MTIRAVFLDRDGVINKNVFYADSAEWESPRTPDDVVLHEGATWAIKKIHDAGFKLFIVSNQPSYAKGKTSLKNLMAVDQLISKLLNEKGATIEARFYAYDHPDAVNKDVPAPHNARKPSPYFLLEAAKKYGVDLANSWMIGDRDTDIECGKNAGTRSILIDADHPNAKAGKSSPDYKAKSLRDAVTLIISKI